jgi:hypothetical protein
MFPVEKRKNLLALSVFELQQKKLIKKAIKLFEHSLL